MSTSTRNTPAPPRYHDSRTRRLRESTLDPQLGPKIKIEPESRSGTPLSGYSIDPTTLNRGYVPSMQSWSTTPYGNSPMTQDHSIFDSLCSTPSDDSEAYAPPTRRPRRSTRKSSGANMCDLIGEDDMEYDDGLNESTKLKGVYWEGMGIFDSATPDMRRKRNQKKASSVLLSLQTTSEGVEPNELVFDEEGDLVREREITGSPNEDDGGMLPGESEPEADTPPKKKAQKSKRSTKPRPALVNKHVNSGRLLRRRDSHHPGHNIGYRGGPYYDGADDDDLLTYGRSRPKKRTGLSIHRDNSGPEITFENPSSFRTLNSAFHPQHAGSLHGQYTHQSGYSHGGHRAHQRIPSHPFGNGSSFRPAHPNTFGSFGQLNHQYSVFQNNTLGQNPFGLPVGSPAVSGFQQPFGAAQHSHFGHEGMFHQQNQIPVVAQNG